MMIPKLLLLVPTLLLVEAQNGPQSDFRLSERIPLRRPIITPGFRSEATVPPMSNTPMTTKKVSEVVTQQYVPTFVKDDEITYKRPYNTDTTVSNKLESEAKKPGVTFIVTDNYIENPTTTSSRSPVTLVSRQPISRPSWSSPINEPSDNRPLNIGPSTTNQNILTSRLPSTGPSYTTPQYIPTSSVTNIEVMSKNPQVPDDKPGFTIIYSDNYTKKPFPANIPNPPPPSVPTFQTTSTTSAPSFTIKQNTVTPPFLSTEFITPQPEKTKGSYTIIIVKNEDSKTGSDPSQNPVDPTVKVPEPTTKLPVPTTQAPVPTIKVPVPTTQAPVPTTQAPVPTIKVPLPTMIVPMPTTREPAPTTSKPTTYQPTTTPVWRFPTETSSTAPTITTTFTTTWKPTTVVQTRPTPSPPQTNPINHIKDYNCRNVNGYYSVENKCDEYIECKSNNAYQITCPDGLHYDSAAKWPSFPCAYPSEVQCQNQSIIQQAQPTSECPHRYGYFAIPNSDCGHYIVCQEGLATVMACPSGLAFNPTTSTCDWPVNVPGCNPSVFEDFTCPTKTLKNFDNSKIFNYRYKNSCKNYIACHEGYPRLLSCDPGLAFDEKTAKCVDSSLIRSCEN